MSIANQVVLAPLSDGVEQKENLSSKMLVSSGIETKITLLTLHQPSGRYCEDRT
jgi:hypothetical protein